MNKKKIAQADVQSFFIVLIKCYLVVLQRQLQQ